MIALQQEEPPVRIRNTAPEPGPLRISQSQLFKPGRGAVKTFDNQSKEHVSASVGFIPSFVYTELVTLYVRLPPRTSMLWTSLQPRTRVHLGHSPTPKVYQYPRAVACLSASMESTGLSTNAYSLHRGATIRQETSRLTCRCPHSSC